MCSKTQQGEVVHRSIKYEERLRPNSDSVLPGHIHCSAPNYKGSFHCSWTRTRSRSNAALLLVKAERWGQFFLHNTHPTHVKSIMYRVLNSIYNKPLVFNLVTWKRFPVSWMLMDQVFTVRMPAAHTKKNSTASPSPFTYIATLALRPTQRLST